jgi:DNA-binding response OmpR family regulator
VEDEVDLCNLIRAHLERDGHDVRQAFDGPSGLALVEAHDPELVVLDWMLPGVDGLAVCREIRRQRLTPIIMLTARSEEVDRVLGLEVGADDYVVKPFGIRELLARVRSNLRRVELDLGASLPGAPAQPGGLPPEPEPVVRGALRVDLVDHRVTLDGAPVELTRREFDLLALLAAHPGRAFSRDFLLERLWGYDYDGFDRTVDSHIVRLRRKLGPVGEKITTVWGVGYRFVE